MTYLTEKYDYKEYKTVGSFTSREKQPPNAHAGLNLIEIEKRFGAKTLKDFEKDFESVSTKYKENCLRGIKLREEKIQEWNKFLGDVKYDQTKVQKQIKIWKKGIKELNTSSKFIRSNAKSSAENYFIDTITHEFGHSLMFRKIDMEIKAGGTYKFGNALKYRLSMQSTKTYEIISEAFEKARKTGDIYNISRYANQDTQEFFAECFAIYERGVEKLPDYINNMIIEVIKS